MRKLILLATLAAFVSGCAMTRQNIKTMDGDEFSQAGAALFSKQQYVHGLDADFYPNNSGAHISVKGQGDQDSVESLKTINLLLGALMQRQATEDVNTAPSPSRLKQLEDEITRLKELVEILRTQ